jgi:hypothetical protein
MIGYAILAAVIGLPVVLGLFFRTNTSFIFFSLLAGELLARYFGYDAELALRTVWRNDNFTAYAEIVVLVLPIIFTALFLRHTLTRGKLIFHTIPLLITGVVMAAFVLPILPKNALAQVRAIDPGERLLGLSEVIIGAVIVLQLITLWLTNRSHNKHGKKHH